MQVTINGDRTIYLGDVTIRSEQLASELARRSDKTRPVVVRADKALPYGDVMRVLDMCRNAGFEHVGLAAERPTTEN